ncbi:MAG TPA: hypothetical protein VJH22_04980 [Candidatus Nanoarchaeia archaeon]|nr:hypothetical protein [Candidatus Nanoarchaeia archaeon]
MKVYVCGNPLVDQDSLPIRMIPLLRKARPDIEFLDFDPTEDLPQEPELVIIDTVIDAKELRVYTDIDEFCTTKAISLHDFDLGLSLKLAKKMGTLHKVLIIGVPPTMSPEEAVRGIINLLPCSVSRNAPRSSCKGRKRG